MDSSDQSPSDEPDDDLVEPERKSPVPWLVGGFLALLATFLVVNLVVADNSDQPAGDPIPDAEFTLLNGGVSSFAAHRGTPLVVNFFASWCPPCVAELPDIQAASETYAGEVDIIGISVSDREADTLALLELVGVTFEVGIDPDGTIHRETSELGVMPTTLFVAADGTLVSTKAGAISAEELDNRIRTELLASQDNEETR